MKDTRYNESVPLVLGTNLVQKICYEVKDFDLASNPWKMAFKMSVARQNAVCDDGKIGTIRCLKQVLVPPFSQITVHGAIREPSWSCVGSN